MRATRFWAAAFFAILVSASSGGCGDGDAPPAQSCTDCGGEGGNPEGLGGVGQAGDDASLGGSSTVPTGGAVTNVGGAGDGGVDHFGGGSAGASSGGEGGTAMGKSGEQLDICVRLAQAAPNATAVDMAYTKAVTLDCRVKWIMPKGQDLANFQNQVLHFNYALWGCPQWPPVESFALVFGSPALSQGDADLLIDHYLKGAQDTLDLSPVEHQEMQAALVRLSKPLIMNASLEPSNSSCPVNMGGAGGADAGGAGGAGGAASNSSGGAQ